MSLSRCQGASLPLREDRKAGVAFVRAPTEGGVPASWAGTEASPNHRVAPLAGATHACLTAAALEGVDPLGRLPKRQPLHDRAPQRPDRSLRVSALFLQQP